MLQSDHFNCRKLFFKTNKQKNKKLDLQLIQIGITLDVET